MFFIVSESIARNENKQRANKQAQYGYFECFFNDEKHTVIVTFICKKVLGFVNYLLFIIGILCYTIDI